MQNIDEIEIQEADFLEDDIEIYTYDKEHFDWVSANGLLLSEYEPTKEELSFINGEYKIKRYGKEQKDGQTKGIEPQKCTSKPPSN